MERPDNFDLREYLAEGWMFQESEDTLEEAGLGWKKLGEHPERRNRFLEKVEKGEPFEMVSGEEAYINIPGSKEFLDTLENLSGFGEENSLRNNRVQALLVFDKEYINTDPEELEQEGVETRQVSLGAFMKTAEFGSSTGSGAGSKKTALMEAAVACLCADISGGTVKFNSSKVGGMSAEELVAKATESEDWGLRPTAETVLEILKTGYNGITFEKCTEFHHQDSFHTEVSNLYLQLRKTSKIFSSLDMNKWNPADIWATTPGYAIGDVKSLDELSKAVFNENCLGISLKKAGTTAHWYVAKEGITNYEPSDFHMNPPTLGNVTWVVRYRVGGDTDTELSFKRNGDAFRAELIGKKARAGNCGQGTLNAIADSVGLKFGKNKFGIDNFNLGEAVNRVWDSRNKIKEYPIVDRDSAQRYACYIIEQELYNLRGSEAFVKFVKAVTRLCASDSEGHAPFVKIS